MREIKFRGKRTDNGEWVYGNLIYSSDAVKEYEAIIVPQKDADGFTTDYASNGENKESYGFDNWFCVIPETVGQSTGLHDKNSKEIYEGDIVKDYEGKLKTVVWKDNGFKFLYISHRTYQGEPYTEDVYLGLNNTSDKRWGVEVIGNVFENPELLESEK